MDKHALRSNEFPVTRNLIYFNHAAVGPLSARTAYAMQLHATDQLEFGALHWREWYAAHVRFRQAAARLINAGAEEISILKNTSEGLSFVAEGFRWKPGENVVTTDMEFPSNFTPWKRLERRGVECRTIATHDGAFTVEDVERTADENTRIVALSSVSFHNGFRPDLEAIGDLCATRSILLCVDAIQSLGAIPMDVKRAKISFLSADAHKWLLGPEGTTIFFCAAEARDRLDVLESGWMNVELGSRYIGAGTSLLGDGRRFEGGAINTNGVVGVIAALSLVDEIGIATIEREVIRLANGLAAGLESIGFRIGSPKPIRSGIVSAIPPGVDSSNGSDVTGRVRALHHHLENEGIVCAPREGMLRLSPHYYNTDEEIERVVDVLRSAV